MAFVVSAYKTYKEFTTVKEAMEYFNKVKHNFSYCELKRVEETPNRYYSKSIEIWRQ